MKVGIQGVRGAFHEEAALRWFGKDVEPCPAHDFPELVRGLADGTFDRAVMAVENTLSGSILPNFRLLSERDISIIGEVRMPVKQNLGVLPGVRLDDLEEVRSHYMALNQCRGYFRGHPSIRLVNETDTALVARQIAEHRWDRIGCVASMRAMELYGLECLAEDIADDPSNLTRFMVLTPHRSEALPEAGDLATITLILPHKRGSLNGALTCLMDHGISLSQGESMVIPGRPYEYEFVMDLEAPETERLHAGIAALRGHADRLVTLGLYGRDRTCDA